MAIFKCKMCGGDLEVTDRSTVVECPYCLTSQTVSATIDEKRINLFNRANRLRMSSEFDKAGAIYEQIIAEFPEEAEAYWGLCLCNYGIEYVDDPATAKKVPTVHRASIDKMRKDENYALALKYADLGARIVYEDGAKEIDRIMSEILAVSKNEQPYDIFICYKESDRNGDRTPDSVLAQDIYDALTAKNYRVFFARITLEDKLGVHYEPYIFSALHSAKIMLVVGTDYDYMNAVWVKNEWSRFIKLMAKDKSKVLIPCYKDMDPYDMPDEFKPFQAQDCAKLGFMQDLTRGIDKIFGRDAAAKTVVKEVSGGSVENLLERANMSLEDGEWEQANDFGEQALNLDPKNAKAYLVKLMADLHVRTQEELKSCDEPFDGNKNCQKAIRFADEATADELKGCITFIQERKENERKTALYNEAVDAMNTAKTEKEYRSVIEIFKSIPCFKDANEQAAVCENKIEEIKAREEAARLAAIASRKRKKKIALIVVVVLLVIAATAFGAMKIYQSSNQYVYGVIENADGTLTVSDYRGKETKVSIPEAIKGKKVTCIDEAAFYGCSSLESVTIPDSVTSIGNFAFAGCIKLTELTIPDGVTSIGEYAINGCSALTSITLPFVGNTKDEPSYTSFKYIFGDVPESLKIVILTGGTSIGNYAFYDSNGLTSITIPDSVTSIGDSAFSGCSGLTSITIPDSVTSIGNYAFSSCSGLTSITIPKSVTSIGNYAFNNCRGLTSITIPKSVTSIGVSAFKGCSRLTSITIPDGVTSIGSIAFSGCSGLTSITIPKSVTSIADSAFYGCSGLTSITISDSVTSIGDSAFYGCSGLTSITIPQSVTSIGNYAFNNCRGLTSITIPKSVTSIGDYAFNGCSKLTSITFNGTKVQWNAISKWYNWNRDTGKYTIHCTDGDINK